MGCDVVGVAVTGIIVGFAVVGADVVGNEVGISVDGCPVGPPVGDSDGAAVVGADVDGTDVIGIFVMGADDGADVVGIDVVGDRVVLMHFNDIFPSNILSLVSSDMNSNFSLNGCDNPQATSPLKLIFRVPPAHVTAPTSETVTSFINHPPK